MSFSQVKISGKVTYKNKPIKEVSITLKDSYDGATTDLEGNYSFETSESGNHTLIFSNPNYAEVEKQVVINNEPLVVSVEIIEKVTEINAVVITAGSIEASDKKRATASLTPMDVYNTAGANGAMAEGIKFFPGVQKTGESEGLFVRGGTGAETKFFMDGNLVNNYFNASVPGIPGHDRFNTSLFKGTSFSSGGYSALYGQALSAILALESVDLPDKTSAGFSVFPFSLTGNFQKLNDNKTASYGIQANYFNLEPMQKLLNFNADFVKSPESFGMNANFRIKTKQGGFLKYYGSLDTNSLAISQPSLELNYDTQQPSIKGKNTFHNLTFKQKIGQYLVNTGASFSLDRKDLLIGILNGDYKIGDVVVNSEGNYWNHKTVVERKINQASNWKLGYELNYSKDMYKNKVLNADLQERNVGNLNAAVFTEANLALTKDFSVSAGLRSEHSSFLNAWNVAPRFAAAYRISPKWVTSFAYGQFFQNPEPQHLNLQITQPFQKAEHYILQFQKSENDRTFRTEIFYKNYNNLEKSITQNLVTSAENTVGNGFAKGFELFWNDKKTFKDFNYRLSYSYLDSRRDYQNYPKELFPTFASKHNLSLVVSKFISSWKSGVSTSFVYSSPRPFYNIVAQNGQNILLSEGQTKDYKVVNFSAYYLPNLGKKEAKSFTILVVGVNNIFSFKNEFGYRFSQDGLRSTAVLPSTNFMVYVGAIFNFGIDKTQQTIDNL
jgi:hypothetical protein